MENYSDCRSGKVQYTAEGVAEKAGDYTGVTVYLCPDCGCWHLTRKSKLREEAR